jgi:hypothetical protein
LTILEGDTPDSARPIMAIRDAQILDSVREMIHQKLSAKASNPKTPKPKVLEVVRAAE